MQYGSRNYWEQKHRIGKLHENARNRRKDFLHKLSRKVSDTFDAVVVEDINLQHMSQALNFGKTVYDNGYGMLRNMLAYKLKDKGKVLVKVDRFFPSSKRCSACHEVNHDLKLSDRQWTRSNCGTHHDRDRNGFRIDSGRARVAARIMTGTGTQQRTCWMREKTSLTVGLTGIAH